MSHPKLILSTVLGIIVFTGFVAAQQAQFMSPPPICDLKDPEQMRVWAEYGAVFISKDIKMPNTCIFDGQPAIDVYLKTTKLEALSISDLRTFKLRPLARQSLEKVFVKMQAKGGYRAVVRLCNTRKVGECTNDVNGDFALRNYKQTADNWTRNKVTFIANNGVKFTSDNPSNAQIVSVEVKSGEKPFMYSYAIPGASQHILGLAIDVKNGTGINGDSGYCETDCVKALADNYWYRTVRGDKYHFTYLGYPPEELRKRGLKTVQCDHEKARGLDQFIYWVPNISDYKGYENWPCKEVPWPL